MSEENKPTAAGSHVEEKKPDSPWATLGWGLVLIAIGVGMYFWFDHMEREGGHIRAPILIILAYETLGKLGVLGIFGGLGIITSLLGLKGIVQGQQ